MNDDPSQSPRIDAGGVLAGMFGGLRALAEHATLRVLVLLVAAGALTGGVTDVLMVTFAETRLGSGGGAAGVMGAALGIGAVLGALASAGLIGRSRLLPYLLAGAALSAMPYFALTGIDALLPAAAMFVAFGMAESLLRVTTDVGIQRGAPDRVLARIFGVCEGLQMACMAVGSLLLSLLVTAVGLNSALAIVGSVTAAGLVSGSAWFRHLGGDVPPPPSMWSSGSASIRSSNISVCRHWRASPTEPRWCRPSRATWWLPRASLVTATTSSSTGRWQPPSMVISSAR